jgi:hypothetical protein
MEEEQVIYELGHWEPKYVLGLMGRLIEFHCFKCKKDLKGITAYEHFSTCCPSLIKELNERKEEEYGSFTTKRGNRSDAVGDSEKPQKDVLFSKPVHISQIMQEVLPGFDFKEAPEPSAEVVGGGGGVGEDPETSEGG